jgi:hypothetical protein
MTKSFRLIILVLCSVGVFPGTLLTTIAQQNNIDTLTKKFDRYRKQNFQEKIYLHIDHPSYLTGETMWFKVYLTDGTQHKPSDISKVAYIEFIDRNNSSVLKTKVELDGGSGSGSLYLPATLSSGNYTLRAYTNWMKNFSAEYYFHKPVSIVNTFKSIDPEIQPASTSYDAQFFPEGGNLIAGIKSKVAFRVTNASGNGIDFKGALLDQRNDTLAKFTPLRFGIGHFSFTPKPDNQYRVVLRDRVGKTQSVAIQPILTMGYSLHVSDTGNNQLLIKVNANLSDVSNIPGAYLFVHSRNSVTHTSFQMLQKGSATFLVNSNSLMDGISHITIFDATMKPVCERLYFKQPENKLNLSVAPNQPQYETRRPVKIDLTSALNDVAKESNLSVSVYRADSLPSFDGSMVDYFWLTSDLKGTIESPEYYFVPSPEVKEATDNLMLTHGWRRFQWTNVLNNKKDTLHFIPEYRGHIIQGKVLNADGSPAYGIMTYLSSPSSKINLYSSRSSKTGDVQFEMQNFYGVSKIVTQTNHKRDSTYLIEIKAPFSDQFANRALPAFQLSTTLENQLLNRSVAMQVQDIYFANEFAKTKSTAPDSSAFYGKADETYLLDAFTRFPVMEEVMREYVPGVMVRKRKDGFHFIVLDNVSSSVFNDSPLVLLDGVPVFDEDEIMNFSPLQVKKLEVMTRRWFLGQLSFSGIVSYTTYQGDLGGFPLHPKSVMLNYEGLQMQREFYSPKYENKNQRESRLPDQRYLLYWNPLVTTDKDGHQQLEFNTSDIPGEFKIVVEGMTKDGNVGSATSTFTVKEFNN